MDLLAERGSRRFYHLALGAPDGFAPFDGNPFTCLLWDASGASSDDERGRLAAALVESGCVYAVCGGADCEAWHDAVDEAFAALQVEGRVPDDRMVMTTWHAGESARDVAEFYVRSAVPAAGAVEWHLVLRIGEDRDPRGDLGAIVRGFVLDDGVDGDPPPSG